MELKANEVRKEIYNFIHDDLGVKMTPEQKGKIKQLVVANARAQAEDLLKQIAFLEESLAKRPFIKKKIYINRTR